MKLIEIDFCTVSVRPAHICRRCLIDFWPYWHSSKAKFELTFQATKDWDQSRVFVYLIEFANGKRSENHQIQVPKLRKGESQKFGTQDIELYYTGDAILMVQEKGWAELKYKPAHMLHITSRSWLALTVIAGILAGIFSALLQWVLNVL